MSTPGSPPPRPRGSHRAPPRSVAPRPRQRPAAVTRAECPGGPRRHRARRLDAADRQATARSRPTPDGHAADRQPSSQPSDTASSEPTDGSDKHDKNDKRDDKNDDKKSGTKNDDDKNDDDKVGTKNDDDAQPVPQIPVYVFNQTTISGWRRRPRARWSPLAGTSSGSTTGSATSRGHRLLLPGRPRGGASGSRRTSPTSNGCGRPRRRCRLVR